MHSLSCGHSHASKICKSDADTYVCVDHAWQLNQVQCTLRMTGRTCQGEAAQ